MKFGQRFLFLLSECFFCIVPGSVLAAYLVVSLLQGGGEICRAKSQKGSTMRIVYVLVRIRTQIFALILLFIMGTDRFTTALSCLLVKCIDIIGYLTVSDSFTLLHGARAEGVVRKGAREGITVNKDRFHSGTGAAYSCIYR